ncbi:N-carbamoyl-L-amino-acid hydrolase [Rhizobium lusitanum]|uniref:N-carbamoyl-L-amino-acid hydrolase n=2 Tax=Rhizobium/Agrobacterium group TaxID=227290 RepID=A0A1C3XHZ7_9HYPH|nr:N-carbamoyl-L-amino-acid hydrolase [Rhizobium lusitanum]
MSKKSALVPSDPNTFGSIHQMVEELFASLRAATGDGAGITREAYSAQETAALDIIEAAAMKHGLASERDAGANLVVTLEGAQPQLGFMACGSHIDSVPQGGNFDGAAGVIAGLAALVSLKREGFLPKRTLKLFALRGEESARFGKAYLGSSALVGQLKSIELDTHESNGAKTLEQCMRDVGADVARIRLGQPLIELARMTGWLELHIEQGPVLAARNLPIGIVTGIRGNIRHRAIRCIGEAGHSGTVPRWLRHDAVFATAELITRLDQHWRKLLEEGHDIVITSGVFGTDPREHAIARIPGEVSFSFEARSQSEATLGAFYQLFLAECSNVAREWGVRFDLDRKLEVASAAMSDDWVERLKRIAAKLDIACMDMASGAGHDAAVFANVGIPAAMIFVRNEMGSHNPREAMEVDDLMVGCAVIREALVEVLS